MIVDRDPTPPHGIVRPPALVPCPQMCSSLRFTWVELDHHLKFECPNLREVSPVPAAVTA